ncbi:potassium transporter Kup, partial [bacterium M00.F.Ca.ET.163.01.1.1]
MALANGAEAEPADQSSHAEIGQHSTKVLMLGALGVVYGDIGTSPIYAFREALHASSGGDVANRADILGVLSLIIWSLTITVTIKYIMFVLRADNRGEGGVLSLMALARGTFPARSAIVLGIGIVGASLFFGDAVITPAISVLSAVEGMNVVTPAFQPYVVPLTLLILAMLFAVQRFGTGGVGLVFGPVTALWFLAIGLSGLKHIITDPEILWAISPHYIVAFFINSPDVSFVTVGAVFLAVTGAEALYADLGHFGRKPIVLAWLAIVFPCLLLNYAGQGAYVLAKGGTVGHPFFEMNEGWALIPIVVL